ncbi:MAG: hypothetical protein KY445_15970, partial [Armatimonadetes bacterium]|nr:hypothetical protein [Armatimonadota bacterium]
MSALQHLFDGSFFEAVLATPPPEVGPPDETQVETFDWDAYNRAFFEKVPERARNSEEGRSIAQIAGAQLWMVRQFPPEVVGFLLQNIAAKSLWKYLTDEKRSELLQTATRGFQRTPQIVRQNVVRARIVHWFEQNPTECYALLLMWGQSEPQPPVIALAAAQTDDELPQKLPILIKKFGQEATFATLALGGCPRAFSALVTLRADGEKLARLLQEADEEDSPCEEIAPQDAESVPMPDSDAARFWKEQFEASEETRRQLCESLEKTLDADDRNRAALAERNAEVESLRKREQAALAQAERKLKNLEQSLGSELSELHKNFERQHRKLRALEREKTEMDNENRRFKKQLRHIARLLEEERKKIAVSEKSQPPAQVAPIDSILTPTTTQSAPNRPVVVQPPTPLDEIFEWRADGRPVKITPRAIRRLIDQNNEDAVFGIMQALEALKHSDRATHDKFLKRLGDASAYYPRVLTERMTRVLVDASNVARHTPNRYGKGQLRHLLEMRDELRRLDCFPILFYADASLRYFIDEATKFRDMVAHGEIIVADKGTEADE